MERAVERDRVFGAAGVVVRDLDRVLDRLCPRVREEDGVHVVVGGDLSEPFHQPGRTRKPVAGRLAAGDVEVLARDLQRVDEVELRERLHNLRVVVPQRRGGDVAREVHEDVAVDVGAERSFGGRGAVPDELVDVRARRGRLVVVLHPLSCAVAREVSHVGRGGIAIHAVVWHPERIKYRRPRSSWRNVQLSMRSAQTRTKDGRNGLAERGEELKKARDSSGEENRRRKSGRGEDQSLWTVDPSAGSIDQWSTYCASHSVRASISRRPRRVSV